MFVSSTSRRTISFASIPSACAAKVVIRRCVSTGDGDVLDVLQPHHVAAEQRRAGLGPEDQVLHGPRAGAPGHQRLEPRRAPSRRSGRVLRTSRAAYA